MEIDVDVQWFPMGARCPWAKDIKYHENGTIVINGHFYLEDATMPVRRIMCIGNDMYLTEITCKKTLEDTSKYGIYDEDIGGRICLTPMNLIEIQYKIIKVIVNMNEFYRLCDELKAFEVDILERDSTHRRIREEAEFKKQCEEWNEINYKEYIEKFK